MVLQGRLELPIDLMHTARARMEQPTPRVALGLALRGVASACADVSDGLLGDLGHILERSQCGARVDVDKVLPLLATRQAYAGGAAQFDTDYGARTALQCVLAGGDDYELVFTAPVQQRSALALLSATLQLPINRIGTIEAVPGLRLVDAQGNAVALDFASFDHFTPAGRLP